MVKDITTSKGLLALSPVAVFVLSYLAVSIAVGDFYRMPIAVSLLLSSIWAVAIYRGHSLSERIETFSRAAGHSNIIYMLWIFVLAGAYASLATAIGAVDATVSYTLRLLPAGFILPGLFIASCFISFSIGTSVGTVVALAPLAAELARAGDGNVAFFVAVVLGGAFFGDNLSFISDTTIAATRSQGCEMRDKFRANLAITLPAAIVTLIIYAIVGSGLEQAPVSDDVSPLAMIPYLVIIVTAIAGVNVTIVLLLGIISAIVMGAINDMPILDIAGEMGKGIDSMGNLIIITLLSAGMLGVIKAAGGIAYLLERMTRRIHGRRGAQGCLAALVAMVNFCTANNTVAIITVGGIAHDIADRYGIAPRRSASLLDTSSCIIQCLIPYGAQTLLATALAGISPAEPLPYLWYPMVLALCVGVSILTGKK